LEWIHSNGTWNSSKKSQNIGWIIGKNPIEVP